MPADDELLDRIRRLERNAARGAPAAAGDGAASGQPRARTSLGHLTAIWNFFAGSVGILNVLWVNIGQPVWNVVAPVLLWIANTYCQKIWDRFAYQTDSKGIRNLSSYRATIVILMTILAAMSAVPLAVSTYGVAMDASKMAFTMRTATVFLHTPDSHGDNTYSVKGCRIAGECDPKDVVYYNIESSLMRHIWTLYNKGSLFVPKRIIGTISPDGSNRCDVRIYGAYYEMTMQQIGIYPELLDVTCVRVDALGRPLG